MGLSVGYTYRLAIGRLVGMDVMPESRPALGNFEPYLQLDGVIEKSSSIVTEFKGTAVLTQKVAQNKLVLLPDCNGY